jgi:hypothetical protein
VKDIERLTELLFRSELKTELLTIAEYLAADPNYKKKHAVKAILKIIDKHQLG